MSVPECTPRLEVVYRLRGGMLTGGTLSSEQP